VPPPSPPHPGSVRIARPTRSLAAVADFYSELVGLPQLSSFTDHDGFSGLIVGLPDQAHQLEFLRGPAGEPVPRPTAEDLLVLYLPSRGRDEIIRRLTDAGRRPVAPRNPFWDRIGAVLFEDPDGYVLVLAPE